MRIPFDIGVAAVLSLAKAAIAVFTYTRLHNEIAGDRTFENINPADAYYDVLQGETCVGQIKLSLEQGALQELRSVTDILVSHHTRVLPLKIETLAYFNPLGQMVTGDVEMKFSEFYLLIQSKN